MLARAHAQGLPPLASLPPLAAGKPPPGGSGWPLWPHEAVPAGPGVPLHAAGGGDLPGDRAAGSGRQSVTGLPGMPGVHAQPGGSGLEAQQPSAGAAGGGAVGRGLSRFVGVSWNGQCRCVGLGERALAEAEAVWNATALCSERRTDTVCFVACAVTPCALRSKWRAMMSVMVNGKRMEFTGNLHESEEAAARQADE